MIHYNSTDPVLVKKISLRIWTLKDEVRSAIKHKISEGEEVSKEELLALTDEYLEEPPPSQEEKQLEGLSIIDGGATEGSEEVADAESSNEEEEEENKEENKEEENEEEDSETEGEETKAADPLDELAMLEAEAEAPTEDDDFYKKDVIKQRVPLYVPAESIFNGTMILSEIEINRLYFFCGQEFLVGQSIVIEFLIPQKFRVNAKVVYCHTYNMKSRIISKRKLPFRIIADFTFLKEGERTLLRNFIKSIEPDLPVAPAAPKAPVTAEGGGGGGDDDDDFGDLDDFDL